MVPVLTWPTNPAGPPASVFEAAWIERRIFGLVLAAMAFKLPLGPGRVAVAEDLAATLSLGTLAPARSPGLSLMGQASMLLPIGDVATRANLSTAVCAAISAVLMTRLVRDVAPLFLAPAPPRADRTRRMHEPLGAIAAALVLVLCLSTVDGATTFSTTAAGLPWMLCAWRAVVLRLGRSPDLLAGPRAAFACGMLAAIEPRFLPFALPPLLVVGALDLRRGMRWPLLAPVAALLPMLLYLMPMLGARAPLTLNDLLPPALLDPAGSVLGLRGALRGAGEQVGVLGLMLAAVGATTLMILQPLLGSLIIVSAGVGIAHAAQLPAAALPDSTPFVSALAALAISIGLGVLKLASKLGPARLPVAAVLTVVAVTWPLYDGYLRPRAHALPLRLLEAAHERTPLRARLSPGTPELSGLMIYGQALGLRPDISINRGAPLSGP